MLEHDECARGFTEEAPDPLRYDNHDANSLEVSGIILQMVPEGARVLDVGCGTGSLSLLLQEHRRASVVGIEPNATRARASRERGLEVYNSTLSQALVSSLGSFDVVVLADVLEHLANPAAMLSLVQGSLSSRGSVIASVPNVAHWSVRVDLLRGRFDYEACGIRDATHLRWFTGKTLTRLFATEGFVITDYRVSAGVNLPDYAVRRPWRWMRRDRKEKIIHIGVRKWPTLFGCQHIVKARMDTLTGSGLAKNSIAGVMPYQAV